MTLVIYIMALTTFLLLELKSTDDYIL